MKMISRRDFLKASAVVGATAAMTACGGSSSTSTAASSVAASSAASSAAATNGSANIGVCIYQFADNFMTLYRSDLVVLAVHDGDGVAHVLQVLFQIGAVQGHEVISKLIDADTDVGRAGSRSSGAGSSSGRSSGSSSRAGGTATCGHGSGCAHDSRSLQEVTTRNHFHNCVLLHSYHSNFTGAFIAHTWISCLYYNRLRSGLQENKSTRI